MKRRRRLSDEAVDELIDQEIERRHTARLADPRWELVDPDDGLPGLVLREMKD